MQDEPWHSHSVLCRFLVLRDHRIGELPSLLQEYEAFGGLAINWQVRKPIPQLCLHLQPQGQA